MRNQILHIGVGLTLAVLTLTLSCTANAHRWYLKDYPNPSIVPCPVGVNCHGSPYCAGFGHTNCLNGKTNKLPYKQWSDEYCRQDSDGDGLSNGDEMGDPCCEWNYGDAPRRTDPSEISHPGDASSVGPYPSCSLGVVPVTPTLLSVSVGRAQAEALWVVNKTQSCVCYYTVNITSPAHSVLLQYVRPHQQPFVICNLQPSTTYILTLTARNLKGSSPPVVVNFTTAAVNAAADLLACSADLGAPRPLKSSVYSDEFPAHIVVALLLFLGFAFFGCFLHTRKDPDSWARNFFLHNQKGLVFQSLDLNRNQVGMVLAFLIAALAWVIYYLDLYSTEIYVWGGGGQVGRVIGRVTLIPMSLILMPVTKNSVWVKYSGLAIDRAVRFHRWLGTLVVVLTWVHGVWMIISYSNSYFGWTFIFTGGAEYNAITGTIAGLFMLLIGASSFEYVRRNYYGAFAAVHILAGPTVLLTLIHVGISGNRISGAFILPGMVMWLVDGVFFLWEAMQVKQTKVLSVHRFGRMHRELPENDQNGFEMDHSITRSRSRRPDHHYEYIKLVVHKEGFAFEHGQFVHILVPSISKLKHPFTIASGPNYHKSTNTRPGTFVLYIKNMGLNTWTDKFINHPAWTRNKEGHLTNDFQMMILGPSGNPSIQVENYKHILLVAGGIGITPISSIFSTLLSDEIAQRKADQADKSKRHDPSLWDNVSMLWVVRDSTLAYHITQQLLRIPDDFEKRGGVGDEHGDHANVADGVSVVRPPGNKQASTDKSNDTDADKEKADVETKRDEEKKGDDAVEVAECVSSQSLGEHHKTKANGAKAIVRGGASPVIKPALIKPALPPSTVLPNNFLMDIYCDHPKAMKLRAMQDHEDQSEKNAKHTEVEMEAMPKAVESQKDKQKPAPACETSIEIKEDVLKTLHQELQHLRESLVACNCDPTAVRVTSGRPDIQELMLRFKKRIQNQIAEGKLKAPQYVGVAICGPLGLCEQVQITARVLSSDDVIFHTHQENFLF